MTALTINSIVALFDEEKRRVDALEEMEYIFVLERPSTLSDKKAFTHRCYSVIIVRNGTR